MKRLRILLFYVRKSVLAIFFTLLAALVCCNTSMADFTPPWKVVVPDTTGLSYTHLQYDTPSVPGHTHFGVDIMAGCGKPIYPLLPGEVVDKTSGYSGGLGNAIMLRHPGMGRNGGDLYTIYLHMLEPSTASGGVDSTDPIGKIGESGFASGCHTHFEIRNFYHSNAPGDGWFHKDSGRCSDGSLNIYACGDLSNVDWVLNDWEDPETFAVAPSVNVMPSGVASPINSWDSEPYTWPGNNLEFWGNVKYDGAETLTYTWNFGFGVSTSGTVTNKNNIAATHAYNGGSYIATLTVCTESGLCDSDDVYNDVVPRSLEVETNLAIQRGLKYLYMNKGTTTRNGCEVNNWSGDIAYTGLAVLAFEDHGHRAKNDQDKDIFAETVENGLNFLFSYMRGYGASMNNTSFADSDINGNGRKIDVGNNNMYYNGIVPMAIANTATPNKIVTDCGSTEVRGKPYKTVLEDMVDYMAYAQREGTSGAAGGWRYTPNSGADNSVSQWPVLGLAAAEGAPFNIIAPSWVKTRLPIWLNYSQCSNGGFGYTSTNWCNVAKTGAGIIAIKYAGGGGNLTNAVNFLNTFWNTNQSAGGTYNIGQHYAMYAVKKGMQYADLDSVGSHDWQEEYNQWYVNNQYKSGAYEGTWPRSHWIPAGNLSAAFGLLVLAPGLVELPPVSDAGIDQEMPPAQNVTFNGNGSSHTDPDRIIVIYEWDFDYDGIIFDVDAIGPIVTKSNGYTLPAGVDTEDFIVALQVTDDSAPPLTSTDTAIVTVTNGNVAPIADPGGPYLGVKNGINAFGRKNFIGTFTPPTAIINDFDFLDTLSARNRRAGISEAVKVALIRDRPFFDYLYAERKNLAGFVPDVMEEMIIRCAEIHIEHIGTGGDPFESGSSRPLDFGHWAAHKIEELTGGQVLHGEAVAMGIALDSIYSRSQGLMTDIELHKIFTILEDIGFDLYHWSLGWMDIDNALKEFQEHLGGELTIPLLNGIGHKTEVHEIDSSLLRKCVNILAKRFKEKEKKDEYRKESDVIKRSSRTIFP